MGRFQPALHGLLYGLPAVCFPAAAVLLGGPGAHVILIVALLASWAASQSLASLGYQRLGRTADRDQAKRLLRAGLLAGLLLVTGILAGAMLLLDGPAAGRLVRRRRGRLHAGRLRAAGAGRRALAAAHPGARRAGQRAVPGPGPSAEPGPRRPGPRWPPRPRWRWWRPCWPPAGPGPSRAASRPGGRAWSAAPSCAARARAPRSGWWPRACWPSRWCRGVHGHGGVNIGALLATLPLSLSMGAAEWCLLRYRRRTRAALRTTRDLKTFGRRARLALLAAAGPVPGRRDRADRGGHGWIASATGLVHPGAHLCYPELVVYLALGSAMFIALALQALGFRAVPVAACAVALAFELAWHELGIIVQLAACVGLLIVLGAYARAVLAAGHAATPSDDRLALTRGNRYMSDIVAVTGAEGFIGSHLTEALVRRGHRVRAMALYNMFSSRGWLDTLDPEIAAEVEVVFGDVRDPGSVRRSWTGPARSTTWPPSARCRTPTRAPRSFVDTNAIGTLHVLEAVRACHTPRLVHTSTSETYGTARTVPISEAHPLQAQSPYAASKVGADKLVESYHLSFGLPAVTLRPFNTFGPRQSDPGRDPADHHPAGRRVAGAQAGRAGPDPGLPLRHRHRRGVRHGRRGAGLGGARRGVQLRARATTWPSARWPRRSPR